MVLSNVPCHTLCSHKQKVRVTVGRAAILHFGVDVGVQQELAVFSSLKLLSYLAMRDTIAPRMRVGKSSTPSVKTIGIEPPTPGVKITLDHSRLQQVRLGSAESGSKKGCCNSLELCRFCSNFQRESDVLVLLFY